LPARAAEALQQGRFKEAIELFRQLLRQDPQPQWKAGLNDAYGGRARSLAAKQMFKEAAMVLENTLAADGTLRDPFLYVTCLVREGQQAKAAAHVLNYIGNASLPANERPALEELAAALLVAVTPPPAAVCTEPAERTQWREFAAASRAAMAAWLEGAAPDAIEPLLNRISLRSAFRPLRLLLKTLITPPTPEEAGRTRRLLDTIAPGSPFHALRLAVEAALTPRLDADSWHRLTPTQQAFVAETGGLPVTAMQGLSRLNEAARGGPAMLFGYLQKPSDLPAADVRSACLNLLPHLPDRLAQFEKSFGPLARRERHRIQALAAEARNDWEAAEQSWCRTAEAIAEDGDERTARLSQGVIYRHLAELALRNREIEGDMSGNAHLFYLERSCEADPDHIPSLLQRLTGYRREGREKDWHRLADEAVQRFPQDSQILLQATQSAVARHAYKKAIGFARRLLQIDPINPAVRRQMIELQVAHARKQMQSGRADLADKELAQANEWERADAPSAVLRIARGLVGLQLAADDPAARETAEALLRTGVALAGEGVGGWFRAVLEAELMKYPGKELARLREELARARQAPPTRPAVLAVITALGQTEAVEHRRALKSLLAANSDWLRQGADIAWVAEEFHILADALIGFEAFDLLGDYAGAARRRELTNPLWRIYEIIARTRNDCELLSYDELDDLHDIAETATESGDAQTAQRISRFLQAGARRRPRRRPMAPPAELPDAQDLELVIQTMMKEMPKDMAKGLREMAGALGPEAAIAMMISVLADQAVTDGISPRDLRRICEAMVAKATSGRSRF
jgi:tetratricopeptide (TPR) repeat protein